MDETVETTLLRELIQHEDQVWQALASGDVAQDTALLSDDFLGVYSDGFAGKPDHTGQLVTGPTIAEYTLEGYQARDLGDDHALLVYRARFRRTTRTKDEVMFVSSIWRRDTHGWINTFSQDTPEIIPSSDEHA